MTHRTARGHLRGLINTVSWAVMEIDGQVRLLGPLSRDRVLRIRDTLSVLEKQKDEAQKFAFTIKKRKGAP